DLRGRAFALALRDFFAGEREDAVEIVAAYGADRLQGMLWRAFADLRSRGIRRPRLPDPGAGADDAPAASAQTGSAAVSASRVDAEARRAWALLDELLA